MNQGIFPGIPQPSLSRKTIGKPKRKTKKENYMNHGGKYGGKYGGSIVSVGISNVPTLGGFQCFPNITLSTKSINVGDDFDPQYFGDWLVVWNMSFIFPYAGNNHPN